MKENIITIISAAFNIAAIILDATGNKMVSEVMYRIMPEVNIIAIGVLWFFGFRERSL